MNGIRHLRIKFYALTQIALALLVVIGFVWMEVTGTGVSTEYAVIVGTVIAFFFDGARRSADNEQAGNDT